MTPDEINMLESLNFYNNMIKDEEHCCRNCHYNHGGMCDCENSVYNEQIVYDDHTCDHFS
jgi:hypothetical protein